MDGGRSTSPAFVDSMQDKPLLPLPFPTQERDRGRQLISPALRTTRREGVKMAVILSSSFLYYPLRCFLSSANCFSSANSCSVSNGG